MGKIVLSGAAKYILFFVLLILLLSFLNLDGTNRAFTQGFGVQLTGSENHSITLAEAAKLTQNYRENVPPGSILGEYFGGDAIQEVLKQGDCIGIRIYYGQKDDATPVLIIVGVDNEGNDMTDGLLMELGFLCPPICGYTNPLTQ